MENTRINEEKIFLSKYKVKDWHDFVSKYSSKFNEIPTKRGIKEFIDKNKVNVGEDFRALILMKPTRSLSGVIPITVFTKPYMCSGNCIYCPTIKDVPKSYLPNEPATQRAILLNFDPYEQIKRRIEALEFNGHSSSKIEIIISGGTWDDYDERYRIHFINEIFRALNDNSSLEDSKTIDFNEIFKEQKINEKALHRCVGMSVETRPDKINKSSLEFARKLGITKFQVGIQSLNDEVLKKNNRGHNSSTSLNAINLLRIYGFKIQIHWMPNLYGSTIEKDYEDFIKIFSEKSIQPDEIKIYPCTVIEGTKLYDMYKNNEYATYDFNDLFNLLIKCKTNIPRYCRISRLYRDIPSNDIVSGSKYTNFRQIINKKMIESGLKCKCIRCREVREKLKIDDLKLRITSYNTSVSEEHFIEYVDKDYSIYGFLRLSIFNEIPTLSHNCDAMIRELHVYGSSIPVGEKSLKVQHTGIGKSLMKKAEEIAKMNNCEKIGVISAIGTRGYYQKLGYIFDNELGYGRKVIVNKK